MTTELKIVGAEATITAGWGGFVTKETIKFPEGISIFSSEFREATKQAGDRVHNRAATILIPLGIAVGFGVGLGFSLALGWILS